MVDVRMSDGPSGTKVREAIIAGNKEAFEKKHGTRLGFMSFFVKAAIEALRRFPAVNASIDGDDIVYQAID